MAPLKLLNTIVLWSLMGLMGPFNWTPMMPRDASLSDSCTVHPIVAVFPAIDNYVKRIKVTVPENNDALMLAIVARVNWHIFAGLLTRYPCQITQENVYQHDIFVKIHEKMFQFAIWLQWLVKLYVFFLYRSFLRVQLSELCRHIKINK